MNRPGRTTLSYRPGGYAEFRARIHAALTPALPGLTTRAESDFSIALIDAAASLGEILTFYTERLVHESYLRTATERLSLVELGKLVGHRLRQGVAATTHLAFHVEPPPAAPVQAATTPFQKMRMPEAVTIPAGVAVRSVPGQGEQPQVFETAEAIQARPEWNLMRPVQTKPVALGAGAKSMHLAGITTSLKAGDLLLFYGSATSWEIRPVASVTTQTDRTLVTWQAALTKAAPLTPYAMRKRLTLFGANAPMWRTMSDDYKTKYPGTSVANDWPGILKAPAAMSSDLDGTHPELAAGGKVVFVQGPYRALFTVSGVSELSRSAFSLSGKVTRVKLAGSKSEHDFFHTNIRATTVFAASEQLVPAESPDPAKVQGGQIVLQGNVANLPTGRTLLVGKELATVASAAHSGGKTTVTLTGALKHSYDRATLNVFGNVVLATHGETVHQILGDGQAAHPFQRFELKHGPLTYVPSPDPSGAKSTLEVSVNDVAWRELPALYPAAATDRAFTTRDHEVRFGDGVKGARVQTGQHNVRARYRKGLGAAGNLPSGALTQLGAPPLGVTGVTNPLPAVGGADPDSAARARSSVPLSTRTLGRAVSLLDYADFARTFAGIAKAGAHVKAIKNVRTIVVTVAGEDGATVPEPTRALLTQALRNHGDPLAPVLVVPYQKVSFGLRMKVQGDAEAGRQALLATFGFGNREFGQPVHRSEVLAAAHRGDGVTAVDLDHLYLGTQLSNQPRLLCDGPSHLLLLTALPSTWIQEMPK